jgi:hypothetical protein
MSEKSFYNIGHQDVMDERIANLEDRLNAVQVSLDLLPDLLSR